MKNLFKQRLEKIGYTTSKNYGIVYTYQHTHGKMIVQFYDNDEVLIYWKPIDEKREINYFGKTPKTKNEINVLIKLLSLK